MNNSTKDDAKKPEMATLYPPFLIELAKVLQDGEAQYGRLNWQGLAMSRVISAMLRHMMAIMMREELCPKSGMLHAAHLAAGCQFLVWWYHNPNHANDDRRFGLFDNQQRGPVIDDIPEFPPMPGFTNESLGPSEPPESPPATTIAGTMDELIRMVTEWADDALGERTYDQAFKKLIDEEIPELRDAGVEGRKDEMADCFIILLDMAKMAGIDVYEAVTSKLEVNKARKWGLVEGVFKHTEDETCFRSAVVNGSLSREPQFKANSVVWYKGHPYYVDGVIFNPVLQCYAYDLLSADDSRRHHQIPESELKEVQP